MGTYNTIDRHYAAFISYAHADEVMAARLHKALETYPVPKHLRAQGKTTKPVFRDVAELTAAHSLSEKIREAVKGSRVLIVLCSPAAKASHWVNEEIRLFRELHGDASILSAIIEGMPETSFPEALIEGGREPLAAALGKDNTGFKLGVTQLAAGMLGTGLDDLVQRGAKRRQRILGAGLAASLALSGVMGFTAFQAVEARNEAQTARGEAEGLVEYMIKDLKFKLEPVGRLDLLEGIGDKAVEYYDNQDIKSLPDDSLTRQAAARQVLAQVALDAGRMDDAQREIEASAALTREVLARNPDDTDAIFAHAQSEFWVGQYYSRQGKLAEMERPWHEYDRLAQILYKKDPTNFDWVMEAAWGKSNLGMLARNLSAQDLVSTASENYSKSINYFHEAIKLRPRSKLARAELADAMSGKSFMLLAFESAQIAQKYQVNYLKFRKSLISEYPNDFTFRRNLYLSEADYFNGYFLMLGKKDQQQLKEALNQLFALTEFDTENVTNKNYFLQSVCNNFEKFDYEELALRKAQLKLILEELPLNSGLNTDYYYAMVEVFDIKIDLLQGKPQSAKNKTRVFSDAYLSKNNSSPQDWKVIYNIFLLHQSLNNQDSTIQFAKLFLTEMSARSDLDYPTIVFRKLKAHLALGNCSTVIPLAQNLKTRGYLEGSELNLGPCGSI